MFFSRKVSKFSEISNFHDKKYSTIFKDFTVLWRKFKNGKKWKIFTIIIKTWEKLWERDGGQLKPL